ncbi:MAG: SPOR domain-containing protein [Desulfobacterales bacterium]|nr:SPOR domain-containing protein [Desulfobacterales bacterium]
MKSIFIAASSLCFIFLVGCSTFQTSYFGVEDEAIHTPPEFGKTKAFIEKAKKHAHSPYAEEQIDEAMALGKKASMLYWDRYDKKAKNEAKNILAQARKAALNSEIVYPQPPPPSNARVDSVPMRLSPPETIAAGESLAEFEKPEAETQIQEPKTEPEALPTQKSAAETEATQKPETETETVQKPETQIQKIQTKGKTQPAQKTEIQAEPTQKPEPEPEAETQTVQKPETQIQEPKTEPEALPTQKPAAETEATQKPKTETETVQSPKTKLTEPKTERQAPKFEQAQTQYAIQVAAFNQSAEAESLKKGLVAKGYPAYHQKAEIDGTAWHRVRIGPYPDSKTAQQQMQKLKTNGLAKEGYLVRVKR